MEQVYPWTTIPSRFRINQEDDQIAKHLAYCFERELLNRGEQVQDWPNVQEQFGLAAHFLGKRSCKTGLLVVGDEGTGKTALLNAIVSVIEAYDRKGKETCPTGFKAGYDQNRDSVMFSVCNFTAPLASESVMRRAFDQPVLVIDNFLSVDGGHFEDIDKGNALLARLLADRNDRQLLTILSANIDLPMHRKLMMNHIPEILKKSYEIIDIDGIRAEGNMTMFYE